MLESLLEGYGLEVTSAENGKDALNKASLNPPDLIVTDILMPVMDGYTLCREWKSDNTLKHIPLVFYTATYNESKDEEFALSLGADRFIIKPQEPDIFMNMLKEVVEDKYTVSRVVTNPLSAEMEFIRKHNEILFKKLEKQMSDLNIANQKISILEKKYHLSFDNASDVIYTIDNGLNVVTVSPSVERILGYKPEDFIGRSASDLGYILTPESLEQFICDIKLVLKGETIPATTYKFIGKGGTVTYGEVSVSSLKREDKIIGVISVARDITERKKVEEELKYLSIHDSLTGLYNRFFFEEELKRLRTGRFDPVGIVMCDLDGLKLVNDNLGHDIGDLLIITAANLLKEQFRDSDIVARIGGDEFAVLLPNCPSGMINDICARLKQAMIDKYIPDTRIPFMMSIGYATRDKKERPMDELIKEADVNMYQEKIQNRQTFREIFNKIIPKS
jgi:diguanylate cyclase (GGDEF)-like protein/PAS domain S-box-containing protein